MDKKERLDILDWNKEFESLINRFELLQGRFFGVALDYKHYINNSWGEKQIYDLRDNVRYRLFCSRFHIELLMFHHEKIHKELIHRHIHDHDFFLRQYVGANPWYELLSDEVTSIFDSIIFHTASSFDYIGTLCNYICGPKGSRQSVLGWNSLAKSVRTNGNTFSISKISDVIDKADRDFVGKLYNHRSDLIHRKSDTTKYSISRTFSHEGIRFDAVFFIGDNIIKEISTLRELNKSYDITVVYASFWILNKAIDYITDILFSLKNHIYDIASQKKELVLSDEQINLIKSVSAPYWKEDMYQKYT